MTATLTAPGTLTGRYEIDPTHSRIGFVARHAMITKVRGSFNEFAGSGWLDPDDLDSSSIEVTLETASVDTRNADRDSHLRGEEFFEADTHPQITFASTGIHRADADTYRVDGELTIKDVTRPVTIDLTHEGAAVDPFGNLRVGFEGSTVVNRRDWGLNWNAALDTGGVLVSEKVTLEFEISAIRTDES